MVGPILNALSIAKQNGLHLPIIYNTSAYDSKEVLNILDNIVDIYLPDMKFADEKTAI